MGATRVAFCIRRSDFFSKRSEESNCNLHDFHMLPISAPAMLLHFTHRAKFKVTGNDRFRFPNGQLTNDIVSLRNGSAIGACLLTDGQGKIVGRSFRGGHD
jgi:hypothetical protein